MPLGYNIETSTSNEPFQISKDWTQKNYFESINGECTLTCVLNIFTIFF